jgi:hypothetical protein
LNYRNCFKKKLNFDTLTTAKNKRKLCTKEKEKNRVTKNAILMQFFPLFFCPTKRGIISSIINGMADQNS